MKLFQASWTTASKKRYEKLLELIRRLAEDDADGVIARHKVLTFFLFQLSCFSNHIVLCWLLPISAVGFDVLESRALAGRAQQDYRPSNECLCPRHSKDSVAGSLFRGDSPQRVGTASAQTNRRHLLSLRRNSFKMVFKVDGVRT